MDATEIRIFEMSEKPPTFAFVCLEDRFSEDIVKSLEHLRSQSDINFELYVPNSLKQEFNPREPQLNTRIHTYDRGSGVDSLSELISASSNTYVMFLEKQTVCNWKAIPQIVDFIKSFESKNCFLPDLVIGGICTQSRVLKTTSDTMSLYIPANSECLNVQSFRNEVVHAFSHGLLDTCAGKLFKTEILNDVKLDQIKGETNQYVDLLKVLDSVTSALFVDQILAVQTIRNPYQNEQWDMFDYDKKETKYQEFLKLLKQWNMHTDSSALELLYAHYFSDLVSSIESICDAHCVLSVAQKKMLLEHMVDTAFAKEATKHVRPTKRMEQIMLASIKKHDISLLYSTGRFHSYVKRDNAKICSRAQESQIKGL